MTQTNYLSKPIISNLPDLNVRLHTGVCVELGSMTSLFTRIFPVCTSFTDDDNFDGMTPVPWRRFKLGNINSRCRTLLWICLRNFQSLTPLLHHLLPVVLAQEGPVHGKPFLLLLHQSISSIILRRCTVTHWVSEFESFVPWEKRLCNCLCRGLFGKKAEKSEFRSLGYTTIQNCI